jgi:hypothetical protein
MAGCKEVFVMDHYGPKSELLTRLLKSQLLDF